jgi:hypothetical protein
MRVSPRPLIGFLVRSLVARYFGAKSAYPHLAAPAVAACIAQDGVA